MKKMNKKGEAMLAWIIIIIFLIIAVPIMWGVISPAVQPQGNTQTLTLVNNTNVTLTYDDIVDFSLSNTTDTWTITTDYTIDKSGGIVKLVNNDLNGSATATYTYEDEGYVDASITRVIIGFLITFFILAIFAFVASKVE